MKLKCSLCNEEIETHYLNQYYTSNIIEKNFPYLIGVKKLGLECLTFESDWWLDDGFYDFLDFIEKHYSHRGLHHVD